MSGEKDKIRDGYRAMLVTTLMSLDRYTYYFDTRTDETPKLEEPNYRLYRKV